MKSINYLFEWLTHPVHQGIYIAELAAMLLGGMVFDLKGLLLAGLGAVVFEALALINVPTNPAFQASVKRTLTKAQFDQALERSLGVVRDTETMNTVQNMLGRVERVARLELEDANAVSHEDVSALRQSVLVYLGLLSELESIERRDAAVSLSQVEREIQALQADFDKAKDEKERRAFAAALRDLREVADRQRSLVPKRQRIRAALHLIPDQVEEIYQAIESSTAGDISRARLDSLVERLHFIEDLETGYDELAELPEPAKRVRATVQQAH